MLQKAPNIIVVCVTGVILAVIASITILIVTNHDPSSVEKLLPTVLSGLAALAGAGSWLYAASSAKSGDNVEKQMNGTLDAKIAGAITTAMDAHARASHQAVTVVTPVVTTSPPSTVEQL